MKNFLKNLLDFIMKIIVYTGGFIFLFIITLIMFWPIIALAVIVMCIFWFLLPIITWIILGALVIFIFLYIFANLD